ncbi:myb family transcription factor PHL5 [Trifolium repens]|nr:myb family transcription factor PHL5 [Trifolium repens]
MYINQWELSQHQSFEPYNIITPLEAIIHESNANETYYHHNIDIPIWNNEFCMTTKIDSPSLLCQASKEQPTTSFQYGLESLMCSSDEDSISSSEKCRKFPKPIICEDSQSPQQHRKVLEADSSPDKKSIEISFQRNQLESCTNQDKKSSTCGFDFASSSNSDFKKTSKGKRRLRWTKELHESFIMIVNQLGGPEKAKPKAILQMMGLDNMLTISHVKSHLQKYRSTLHTHKALKGTSEEEQRTKGINELQVKIQMQIEESRQLQLEVERTNQRQLELQENLQLVIEQQRKQLKSMLYQQKQRTKLENNLEAPST